MGKNETLKTVSVLVPMYNAEAFIDRCLSSIIAQTYPDYEVILLDDGSSDKTLECVRKYEKLDSRIRVFSQCNKGVAAARNACLRFANGEYIQFIDSDDWIEPNMLSVMVKAMEDDIDIVYCHNDKASRSEQVTAKYMGDTEYLDNDSQIREFLRHKKITGMLWNKLIRRKLFDGVVFDERFGYGEDAQGLWQVLQKSRRMTIIPDVLYHHTDNPSSISETKYSHAKFMANIMWAEIAKSVNLNYPQYLSMTRERQVATATYTRYEMMIARCKNYQEKQYLEQIVRDYFYVIKGSSMSRKMKLFAIIVYLGL